MDEEDGKGSRAIDKDVSNGSKGLIEDIVGIGA